MPSNQNIVLGMLGITLLASGFIGIVIQSYLAVQTPRGGQPYRSINQSIDHSSPSTEKLSVTNVCFSAPGQITLTPANTGSTHVIVTSVQINNGPAITLTPPVYVLIQHSTEVVVSHDWAPGGTYVIILLTQKGNTFVCTCVAPV